MNFLGGCLEILCGSITAPFTLLEKMTTRLWNFIGVLEHPRTAPGIPSISIMAQCFESKTRHICRTLPRKENMMKRKVWP